MSTHFVVAPCLSPDQPGWLAMRALLWPEASAATHAAEAAVLLASPARACQYVAYAAHGEPTGFVEATVRGDPVNGASASPCAFLEGLYVRPPFRRQGVARALVARVEAWAAARGWRELASDALLDNADGQSAHLALGFVATERVAFFLKSLPPQPRIDVPPDVAVRAGVVADATCLAGLGLQVFLDTYALQGIRPALVREALQDHRIEAVAARLAEPGRAFVIAELAGHAVGFAELALDAPTTLLDAAQAAMLDRLYVHPRFAGRGIGRRLLAEAEARAAAAGASALWLTAWAENARALRFYPRCGYALLGSGEFTFESDRYDTRIYGKRLDAAGRHGVRPSEETGT